jgi:hypothetical protein
MSEILDLRQWISSIAPSPRGKIHRRISLENMGTLAWNVLELAAGNPVLAGYLSYIVGLLIAIAVAKATEVR